MSHRPSTMMLKLGASSLGMSCASDERYASRRLKRRSLGRISGFLCSFSRAPLPQQSSSAGSSLIVSLFTLPVNAERRLVVVVVHSRSGIHSDIERLINRHDDRDCVRDRLFGDFLAVHRQDAGAALAETGTVVFEVKHDGVLAGCKRVRAFPAETLPNRAGCR